MSARIAARWLAADDLWRDAAYRRVWLSLFASTLAGQVGGVAMGLTAAEALQATPWQMGCLSAVWVLPFILFSIPAGVWIERVRKLPIYVGGEAVQALALLSVPLAWLAGVLSMPWLYVVGFVTGSVSMLAGTAGQVVLTQLVARERLVAAHARNALATSGAELLGPGLAGALLRLFGAPLSLLGNVVLLVLSLLCLRRLRSVEPMGSETAEGEDFATRLRAGLRFVFDTPVLRLLALSVGAWQVCQTCTMAAQVLFATRELGLSGAQLAWCGSAGALGTVLAGSFTARASRRYGAGPCMIAGMALSGLGMLQESAAQAGPWAWLAVALLLFCYAAGTVLIFSTMLALRQALTPPHLLARMTATMRFMTLLPAFPGALLGGWIGATLGVRWAVGLGGAGALGLALALWLLSSLPRLRALPAPVAAA